LQTVSTDLYLAQKDTKRLEIDNKDLEKKLNESRSSHLLKVHECVAAEQARDRYAQQLKTKRAECIRLDSDLEKHRISLATKTDELQDLRVYRTYIEFIGKHLAGKPKEPKIVASNVLQTIEQLRSEQQDQSMTTDESLQSLTAKIEALNEKALTDASERGLLSGKFENECANHQATKRELKQERKSLTKEVKQLEVSLVKEQSLVGQLEDQVAENESAVQKLKQQSELQLQQNTEQAKVISENKQRLSDQENKIEGVDAEIAEATKDLEHDLSAVRVQLTNSEDALREVQGKLAESNGKLDTFQQEMQKANDAVTACRTAIGPGEYDLPTRIGELVESYNSTDSLLSAKDAELQKQLAAKDEDLGRKVSAKDAELKQEQNKTSDLDQRLSTANKSLAAFKTKLLLSADTPDTVVDEHLSTAAIHVGLVYSAREQLEINRDNGDVLAAIRELQRKLETAISTAGKAATATEESKTALQQTLGKIRSHLDITSPDVDVANEVAKLSSQYNIAKGDQLTLQDIRQYLPITSHRDTPTYVKNIKERGEKNATLVRETKAQLGDSVSDDKVVDTITKWTTRATTAESIISRARILLEIDPTTGEVPSAISKLKDQAIAANKSIELVKSTFAFHSAITFDLAVKNLKSRLDAAETIVRSARTSLDLSAGGDVDRAIGDLNKKVAEANSTCQGLANSLGVAVSENVGSILAEVRMRLEVGSGRLDNAIFALMEKHSANVSTIASVKQALSIDVKAVDQEIVGEIGRVRDQLQSATDTLKLSGDFLDGVRSIKSRLDTAETMVRAARDKFQLKANDNTDVATSIENLQRALQERDDDIKHARGTLSIDGPFQSGIDSVKTRIGNLDETILKARTSLELVASNMELLPGLELAIANANQSKENLKAKQQELDGARNVLELSENTTLLQGVEAIQRKLEEANTIIQNAEKSLPPNSSGTALPGAIDKVQKEIANARILLKLKPSTTLQQGIEDVQTALRQAEEVVKKSRKSLKLAETELDVAGAVQRIKQEVDDAREHLKLKPSTTLQQGLTTVTSEAQKTKTKLEAIEGEVRGARTLLKISEPTTLETGITTLQTNLTQTGDVVKEARGEFADTEPDLVKAIRDFKLEAQEVKVDLKAKEGIIRQARSLLKLSEPITLDNGIENLQKQLASVQSSADGSNETSKTRIQEVEEQLKAKSKEIEDAMSYLKAIAPSTLQGAIEALQTKYVNSRNSIVAARKKLKIDNRGGILLPQGIQNLQDELYSAETEVKNAKQSLGLQPGITLESGIFDLLQRFEARNNVISRARIALGLSAEGPLDLAAWRIQLDSAEATVKNAKELLNLDANTTLGDGLLEWKGLLEAADETIEDARKSLEIQPGYTLAQGLITARDNSAISSRLQLSLQKLLVPGKRLGPEGLDMMRSNHVGVKIVNRGDRLEFPPWSLAIASLVTTRESFDQLTERLRLLMIFGSDVLDQLEVLESLIQQVHQCTLEDLRLILDTLCGCWICSGHLVKAERIAPVRDAPSQSSLQVLFEARLLELLFRGLSVLSHGWGFVRDTFQQFWLVINKSVIDNHPVLQAYQAWFESLDTTPIDLLQALHDIVMAVNPARVCRERSGTRVLVANLMEDGSHCFLWDVNQVRGSLYAVSELQYHIVSAATVFPSRREAGGVIVADPAFIEPMPKVFVKSNMTTLHKRGTMAIYHI
jgi:hypothetical protein